MTDLDRIQEAPTPPLIELEHALADWAKGNVAALAVLSKVEDDEQFVSGFFSRLNAVFAFDRALVLEDAGDGLHCIAAEPATLAGRHWPDRSLRDALHVQAMPAGGARDAQDSPPLLLDLAASEEPALCLPIGVERPPRIADASARARGARLQRQPHHRRPAMRNGRIGDTCRAQGKQVEAEIATLERAHRARSEQSAQQPPAHGDYRPPADQPHGTGRQRSLHPCQCNGGRQPRNGCGRS